MHIIHEYIIHARSRMIT